MNSDDEIIAMEPVNNQIHHATSDHIKPGAGGLQPPQPDSAESMQSRTTDEAKNQEEAERVSSHHSSIVEQQDFRPPPRRTQLARKLKERHVNMIAFSTLVGVGLFLQNGRVIYLAGPGIAFLVYPVMVLIIWAVMGSLGEMTALFPVPGAIFELPARFLDESIGYAAGWMAWFSWVVIFAAELNSIGALFQFKFDESYLHNVGYPQQTLQWSTYGWNNVIWITIFLFAAVVINFLPVKLYGELEYIIGVLKMLFVVGLIMFQFIIHIQSGLGTTYYRSPYTFITQSFTSSRNNTYYGSAAQFAGVWSGLVTALYSLIGFESISVSAAESEEFGTDRKFAKKEGIKISTRKISIRIGLLYCLSTLMVSLNVPADDPNLVDAAQLSLGGGQHSAFVIAAVRLGYRFWPSFMNGFFVLSATSAAINSLYLSSRLLHAMALSRPVWPDQSWFANLRSWLEQVTERGVPRNAVLASSTFGLLGYLACGKAPAQYLGRLAINATISMLLVYVVICMTFLRFKVIIQNALGSFHSGDIGNHREDARVFDRNALLTYPYKSRGQPLRAFLAGLICLLVVLFNGWRTITPFRTADFLACYISVFVFGILWILYRLRALRQADTSFWKLEPTKDLSQPTRVKRSLVDPGRDHLNLDIDNLWTADNAKRLWNWIVVWTI